MDEEISMKLGGNKMVLRPSGTWALRSSDLDAATFEIEKLVEEKETLSTSLVQCLDQIDELRKEVVDVNAMKTVILEMVRNLFLQTKRKPIICTTLSLVDERTAEANSSGK
jgi:hypothetical protein